MGLFGSKSSNATNVTETNVTETRQTDQSGGVLTFSDIAGAVGITLTDQGAVEAGIAAASDAGERLATSYGQSLTVLQRVNADSLELLAGLAEHSIDASRTLARDSAESHAGFLEQALTGFGSLAKQNTQSADDRLTKVVAIALAAVAAVVVLPAIFKSGGKAVIA